MFIRMFKGIMNGKHYNHCWLKHDAFAQAVEQLFADEYLETLSPKKINVSILTFYNALMIKKSKSTSVVLSHLMRNLNKVNSARLGNIG